MRGGDAGELKIQGNDLTFCVGSDWKSRVCAALEAASGRWELEPFWFALSDGQPLEMGRHNWLQLKHCRSLEECFEQLCRYSYLDTPGADGKDSGMVNRPVCCGMGGRIWGLIIAGDRCFKQSRWRRPIQVIPVFDQLVTR